MLMEIAGSKGKLLTAQLERLKLERGPALSWGFKNYKKFEFCSFQCPLLTAFRGSQVVVLRVGLNESPCSVCPCHRRALQEGSARERGGDKFCLWHGSVKGIY